MNKQWVIRSAILTFVLSIIGLMIIMAIAFRFINTKLEFAQSEEILNGEAMLPLAAVEDGQLKLFGFEDDAQVIADLPLLPAGQYTWSPDGNFLLYKTISDDGVVNLMMVDTLGSEPIEIATGLNTLFTTNLLNR